MGLGLIKNVTLPLPYFRPPDSSTYHRYICSCVLVCLVWPRFFVSVLLRLWTCTVWWRSWAKINSPVCFVSVVHAIPGRTALGRWFVFCMKWASWSDEFVRICFWTCVSSSGCLVRVPAQRGRRGCGGGNPYAATAGRDGPQVARCIRRVVQVPRPARGLLRRHAGLSSVGVYLILGAPRMWFVLHKSSWAIFFHISASLCQSLIANYNMLYERNIHVRWLGISRTLSRETCSDTRERVVGTRREGLL